MPPAEPTNEQLDTCSSAILSLILDHLRTDRGVHIETAIWAAGGLAGLAMLRDTGIDVSTLPPGQVVLSDAVNERGPELMGYLAGYCNTLGIEPDSGWADDIAEAHKSQSSALELNSKLERAVLALYEANEIASAWRAMVTGLAGVRLIKMGAEALSPEIGKALLIYAIQEGARRSRRPQANPTLEVRLGPARARLAARS